MTSTIRKEPAERWAETANPHLDLSDDRVMPYHQKIAELVAELVDGQTSARVLDLGCGLGETSRLLHRLRPTAELVLADGSSDCLVAARSKIPDARTVLLELSESGQLDLETFGGDRFDVVIMSHVAEHLVSPGKVLRTVLDGLVVPGGFLVVAVPNPVRPDAVVKTVLRRNYANRGHYYSWDRSHYQVFLEEQCGFTVREIHGDVVPLVPARWRKSSGIIARAEAAMAVALPWLTLSHIAVIEAKEQQ